MPEGLRYRWVGETRPLPAAVPAAVESSMKIDSGELTFYATEDGRHPLAISRASSDATGEIRLVFESGTAPCAEGDEGVYRFELSPTARSLQVTVVDDPCAQRVDAISGAWTRAACPTNHLCLGDLDAGHHDSVIYTPFMRFADWHYVYGRFGYSVPDGWTNPEDNQDGYVLTPIDASDGTGIYVFSDVLAHEQKHDPVTQQCVAEPDPDVYSSAPAISDWIRSLDGLRVTKSQPAYVGGLHGYSMDLAVAPSWTGTCGYADEAPGVPLFVNAQTTPDEGLDWGIEGDIRMRLFILLLGASDIGQPGRTLLVDIEGPDQQTWEALLVDAMPIVESFEFKH